MTHDLTQQLTESAAENQPRAEVGSAGGPVPHDDAPAEPGPTAGSGRDDEPGRDMVPGRDIGPGGEGGPGSAGAVSESSQPATGSAGTRTTATPRRPALAGRSEDNRVTLRGRVSSAPVTRELPSGAVISTFRVSVQRARTVMTAGSSQGVDWIDCAAWSARIRRRVDSWAVGDEVQLAGALRRRFFRAGVAPSTRLELEVLEASRSRAVDAGEQ